jgi:hypothetical protein
MAKELDLKIDDAVIRTNFQIIIELLNEIETIMLDLKARVEALEAP